VNVENAGAVFGSSEAGGTGECLPPLTDTLSGGRSMFTAQSGNVDAVSPAEGFSPAEGSMGLGDSVNVLKLACWLHVSGD